MPISLFFNSFNFPISLRFSLPLTHLGRSTKQLVCTINLVSITSLAGELIPLCCFSSRSSSQVSNPFNLTRKMPNFRPSPSGAIGKCVVCGKETATRCSACSTAGLDWMFFCSIEHQKLVSYSFLSRTTVHSSQQQSKIDLEGTQASLRRQIKPVLLPSFL